MYAGGEEAARVEELEMRLAESNCLLGGAQTELEETRTKLEEAMERLAETQAKLVSKENELVRGKAEIVKLQTIVNCSSLDIPTRHEYGKMPAQARPASGANHVGESVSSEIAVMQEAGTIARGVRNSPSGTTIVDPASREIACLEKPVHGVSGVEREGSTLEDISGTLEGFFLGEDPEIGRSTLVSGEEKQALDEPGGSAQTDRAALEKVEVRGSKADRWGSSSEPLNRWHGVTVDHRGRVVRLELPFESGIGPIPKELIGLAKLLKLLLSKEQLTGPIPKELGELAALRILSLFNNRLTGPIPMELGRLAALQELCLSDNLLTGSIPKELGGIAALRTLSLSDNQLTGPIPTELGGLSALQTLSLFNNKLTGSIPRELAGLVAMQELKLFNNRLTGTFPMELLDPKDLRTLRVKEGNNIVGAPPYLPDKDTVTAWRRRGDASVSGPERKPYFVEFVEGLVSLWHFLVPIIDDITDVILLVYTFGTGQDVLWWTCLCVLAVAEVDRLYVLLLMVVGQLLSVLFSMWCFFQSCYALCTTGNPFENTVGYELIFFKIIPLGQEVASEDVRGLMLDANLWVLLGSRARSSDLMSRLGLAGQEPAIVEERSGHGLRAIDELVHHHPLRWLGELLFRYPYGHRLAKKGEAARRAEAMTKAVGETLVVDTLFFALGIATSGWDWSFTGVAGISALFSVLELVSELQYYVDHAVSYMKERGPNEPAEIAEPRTAQDTTATA